MVEKDLEGSEDRRSLILHKFGLQEFFQAPRATLIPIGQDLLIRDISELRTPRVPKPLRASSFHTRAGFPNPGHMGPPDIFRGYTHLVLSEGISKAVSMSPRSHR
jgi:hypothetical protein